jgi:hypothetical protein
MPTTTTTYSFNKPVVGADEDDWGGYLNGNWDSVDDLLDGTTPVTGIDINSGTLDGVTIGGTTAGAGTFTTLTANTSITGTLATAAQPNITSVGTLTGLTVSASASLAGASTTADITFGDDDKAIFGAGSDLEIYHDGSHSYVHDKGTGNLMLRGTNIQLRGNITNELFMNCVENGRIDLYYDNAVKLATTSTGVDITGTLTSDGLTLETNNASINFTGTTGNNFINVKQGLRIDIDNDDDQGATSFGITHGGGTGNIFNASENGDISFYEDTGTTAKFFWDSSAESLGIGTTSPAGALDISGGDVILGQSLDLKWMNTARDTTFGVIEGLAAGTVFKFGSTEHMRIDSSGNVGINNTNPSGKLHIGSGSSSAAISGSADELILDSAGNAGLTIATGSSAVASLFFADAGSNASGYIQYTHSNDALAFATNNASEAMRIDSNGNVGIGTSSPSHTISLESAYPYISFNETDQTPDQKWVIGGASGNFVIYDDTDSATRIAVDGSGNVGIGTATPQSSAGETSLTINGSTTGRLDLRGGGVQAGTISSSGSDMTVQTGYGKPLIIASGTTAYTQFKTNGVERMRIDSSGNLLVGTTTVNPGVGNTATGVQAGGSILAASRSGNISAFFNRNTSDGNIVQFHRDGTAIGSIGVASSAIHLGNQDTGIRFAGGSDAIQPWNSGTNAARDAAIDIGTSSARFKDLYLSGGVYLGGTGSANKLDDYEEGTWTPAITGASTNPSVTYTNAFGVYVKTGEMVHVSFKINTASFSGGSGAMLISNLPFASYSANSLYRMIGVIAFSRDIPNNGGPLLINGGSNLTEFNIYRNTNSDDFDTALLVTDVTSGTVTLHGSLTYRSQ